MRTGKLAEPVLKRSVLRQLNTDPAAVRDRCGADCAVLGLGDGVSAVCASAGDVPGFEDSPEKLVISAANNLAAGGAVPVALLVQALLPADCEEARLKEDMRRLAGEAGRRGMEILGGHTQVSGEVSRPWYFLTAIGRAEKKDCRQQEKLQPGWDLLLTKWIGLGGTAALVKRYEEDLKKRYPFSLVERAGAFESLMSVEKEAAAAAAFGRTAMHDLSQGGVFGGLWEMAERAGVGLEVDLKKIPVKQETIEICEFFDINPYYLYSAGSLLIGTGQGEALAAALAGIGIPAAVIGRTTAGNDRVIRNGGEVRFLDRPKQDEWYRLHG